MPKLTQFFHTTPNALQLTMTAWFAGVALPQLFFGPLSDKYGRRLILLNGGLCFLFGTLLCAFSTNIYALIAGRFVQGIGVCSLNVASFAILIDSYLYEKRVKLMNKLNMFGILAPLIGPLVGGYVFTYFGWQANFYLIFGLSAIGIAGLWCFLPETNLNHNKDAMRLSNLMANYKSLFQNQHFLTHIVPYCLLLGTLVAYLTAAPFIIINELKVNTAHFGFTQIPIFLTYLGGGFVLNRLSEKTIKQSLKLGLWIVFASGILFFGTSLLFDDSLWILMAPIILFVLGFSLCGSPLVTEGMANLEANKGIASAILGFGMASTCTLATIVLETVYNGSILSLSALVIVLIFLAVSIFAFSPKATQVEVELK